MGFNGDWFVFHADKQGVGYAANSACGKGFPTFEPWPGCDPPNPAGSPRLPYHSDLDLGVGASWVMPEAAVLKQFVACTFPFGNSSDINGTVMEFFVDGVRYAGFIKNNADRQSDRGTVWDLDDKVVLQGTTLTIKMNAYQTNRSTSDFIVYSLIGQWLRSD